MGFRLTKSFANIQSSVNMNHEPPSMVIGIDVGTTSIKGMLMDDKGGIQAFARQEYTLDSREGGICEIVAETYWEVACQIIRELIVKSEVDPLTIGGLAFSSQGETLIPVDRDGKPLRKAIVWLDNRSVEEAGEIKKQFGEQRIMEITGQPEVLPLWPATRILWMKKHEPQIFGRVSKFLLVEDFLIFKMTGKYSTEHSLSSSTLYFDISEKKWWFEMLHFLDITETQLPALVGSGTIIGNLTPEAALATGMSSDALCVAGAYDHPAGAIGSGNIHAGDATLTIGASMAMCIALDQPVMDRSLNLPCQCHAVDGLYFLLPYGQTAGMVLKWFKDMFGQEEVLEAERLGLDCYDLLVQQAENVPAGSEGLLMLPHLMGTGSPEFNPNARGAFAGITMGMHKGHFVRAIMESVCLMIRHNLEVMKENGIEVKGIHILGGASKSRLWNQILADVTGLPVATLKNSENAVMGACLLASVGIGVYPDIESACQNTVKPDSRYTPDLLTHELYNGLYNNYVHLYASLENYWKLSN